MKLTINDFKQEIIEKARKIHTLDDLLFPHNNNSIFAIDEKGKYRNNKLLTHKGGKTNAFFHYFFGVCLTNLKQGKLNFNLKYKIIQQEMIKKGFESSISDQFLNFLFKDLKNKGLIKREQVNKSNYWLIHLTDKIIMWLKQFQNKKLLYDLQNSSKTFEIIYFFKERCKFFKKKIDLQIQMCRRVLLGGIIKVNQNKNHLIQKNQNTIQTQQIKQKSTHIDIEDIFTNDDLKEMFG